MVIPSVSYLRTLESQSVIRSWIANVTQFCDEMAIPEDQRTTWALSGLEKEAASVWRSLLYLRKTSLVTFRQMSEMLLKQTCRRHSIFNLWSQ